jgi:hypothetical protein
MIGSRLRLLLIGLLAVAVVGALAVRDRQLRKRYEARLEHEIAQAREKAGEPMLRRQRNAAPALAEPETPTRLVPLTITDERRRLAHSSLPAFDPEAEVEVPFTRFLTASHKARLLIRPAALASALDIAGVGRISFPRTGVPLKMVELAPGRFVVFFREMFSGRLWLLRTGGATIEKEIQIRSPGDAEPILREAILHRGRLLAILYDNEREVNEVVRLDPDTTDAAVTPAAIATLPTLEEPAGSHYEMMPSLFMMPSGEDLWIVGGTLVAMLGDSGLAESHRLQPCQRAQEVVTGKGGPVVLCLGKPDSVAPYVLSRWRKGGVQGAFVPFEEQAVPFALGLEEDLPATDRLASAADIGRLLRHDLELNQVSGVMELGTNNFEGRVAWSQIYFLNGLLDLVRLARSDNAAFARFGNLAADAKRRLDIEVYLIDRLVGSEVGFRAKGFTVRRKPAIFAVQTARLLLLFNRYHREIPGGAVLSSHRRVRDSVMTLDGHIDEMRRAEPASTAPRPGHHYIAWPKGSAFYFDGLNVPYNHQNEWAYAILDTLKDLPKPAPAMETARAQAAEIIDQFLEAVAPGGAFPGSGKWPYWWGKAAQGWTEAEGVSINKPSYAGDKSVAFISFRSIDVMSVLAARRASDLASRASLIESIHRLVARGQVYPFVAASFVDHGYRPALEPRIALHYLRLTAPWELQSAVWALLDVPTDQPGRQ